MAADTLTSARETVLHFIDALNQEDFSQAKALSHADLSFVGVLGSRDGADAYFNDMQKMKLKYNVQKVFVEGDDVCVLYSIGMSGKEIPTAGFYHVDNGKVKTIQVIFDPRPVLEKK
jgi:hypothetical protein